jgi:hypothetical protein
MGSLALDKRTSRRHAPVKAQSVLLALSAMYMIPATALLGCMAIQERLITGRVLLITRIQSHTSHRRQPNLHPTRVVAFVYVPVFEDCQSWRMEEPTAFANLIT